MIYIWILPCANSIEDVDTLGTKYDVDVLVTRNLDFLSFQMAAEKSESSLQVPKDLEVFFCPLLRKVISETSNLWYNDRDGKY